MEIDATNIRLFPLAVKNYSLWIVLFKFDNALIVLEIVKKIARTCASRQDLHHFIKELFHAKP